MSPGSRRGSRPSTRNRLATLLPIFLLGLVVAACAARHKGASAGAPAKPAASAPAAEASAAAANPARSRTTIQIGYSRKHDFLRSVTVTKFTAARLIPVEPGEEKSGVAVVRFEGDAPIWEIHADLGVGRRLLTDLPIIDAGRGFAVRALKYGDVPKGFIQTSPDSGLPEPLEPDSYYVFRVERASGSISYQAVKVQSDGSILGYDAQPRAGSSYALCCNVSADFASAADP